MPKKKRYAKKSSKKVSGKRHAGVGVMVAVLLVGGFILYLSFFNIKRSSVTTFEQCVAKGNPAMESYPRQCAHDGKTFIEGVAPDSPQLLQIGRNNGGETLQVPRGNYVINNAEEWEEAFGGSYIDPGVDFDEKTVIALVMGEKPSGGYSISIKQVVVGEDRIDFTVKESVPGGSCVVPAVITYPYQMLAIDKTNKSLNFTNVSTTEECN